MIKPKLLAPAGDLECLRAAIENGADAIYFGLERFNARMRAHNFTLKELPDVMQFLHERGALGYVTFNTLIFTNELNEAEDFLRGIIAAGADAAIVQDLGICNLIRSISPDFPIHASTQMTITSAKGIQFAEHLGATMTALGRECSIAEINLLNQERRQASKEQNHPERTSFPLEVFIHGALCMSCSGQCLASESLGGRSANRGECAQPCRLPYQLIQNGEALPTNHCRFPLSPKDLAGLEQIPDLIHAGVTCFKIEGRLKSPEYVASICHIYRQGIDISWKTLNTHNGNIESCRQPLRQLMHNKRYELEVIFSRGLGTGWLLGTNHQQLCHARFSNNKGFEIGKVVSVDRYATIWVQTKEKIKPGDGIAFINPATEETVQAGRVYDIESADGYWRLGFSREFNPHAVQPQDIVYKTSDPTLTHQLQQTYSNGIHYRRPIEITVEGTPGTPLKCTFQDETNHAVTAFSAIPLQEAISRPLTPERLQEQLGRLGDTPFALKKLNYKLKGNCMLPISELNHLRRKLSDTLLAQRRKPNAWHLTHNATQKNFTKPAPLSTGANNSAPSPELIVLVRNIPQLDAALTAGIKTIYCDFSDITLYREAVAKAHNFQIVSIWVAPPRIFKPGETNLLKCVLESKADGYLIRNYDHLDFFKGHPCIGDYTLNVANPISAEFYTQHCGLQHVTLSYDLNNEQITSFLQQANPNWFEYTLHQHVPMFHTAHCLFCKHLTHEPCAPKCGKACRRNTLALRDRTGVEHPVLADAACRNTIFNGRVQTACENVPSLLQLGIKRFRIECVQETPETLTQWIHLYTQLLTNKISGTELWQALKQSNLPLTRGSLNK